MRLSDALIEREGRKTAHTLGAPHPAPLLTNDMSCGKRRRRRALLLTRERGEMVDDKKGKLIDEIIEMVVNKLRYLVGSNCTLLGARTMRVSIFTAALPH